MRTQRTWVEQDDDDEDDHDNEENYDDEEDDLDDYDDESGDCDEEADNYANVLEIPPAFPSNDTGPPLNSGMFATKPQCVLIRSYLLPRGLYCGWARFALSTLKATPVGMLLWTC